MPDTTEGHAVKQDREPTTVDAEVQAMTAAYEALRWLDPQARYRVAGWLNARLSWDSNEHDEEPF